MLKSNYALASKPLLFVRMQLQEENGQERSKDGLDLNYSSVCFVGRR